MYNEAMCIRRRAAYEDAIRVLPKRSPASRDNRHRCNAPPFVAVLYQQLGQLYRDTQNYQAAVNTYEELGRPSR